MPLRAWYPFEVLTFPLRDVEQATRAVADRDSRSTLEEEARQATALGDAFDRLGRARPLVKDTRARDVLASLAGPPARSPSRTPDAAPFRAPDLVDDAAYAVECAAVGEVDLPRLERYVGELEGRVAWLEQRLWPRLLRRVTALTRR